MLTKVKNRNKLGLQYHKFSGSKVEGYSNLKKVQYFKNTKQLILTYNPHSKWAAAKYNMIVYGMKPA
jgi:hypothetical protein